MFSRALTVTRTRPDGPTVTVTAGPTVARSVNVVDEVSWRVATLSVVGASATSVSY